MSKTSEPRHGKMCLRAYVDSGTNTCLFQYIENFATKNENFQVKNSGSFHISAQNIDCGYLLELGEAVLTSTHYL